MKMVHCLAKHGSDTVKYEMEMIPIVIPGSKRTVEDPNLAQQDADRPNEMPCKKKMSLKKMFGGSLPSPVATNPRV